jgi:isopropylmalate/homocitrate/citramalate synthase
MANTNAEILNHFYRLLAEVNFHEDEKDMHQPADPAGDAFIQKHLRQIKLLTAQYKAQQTKSHYQQVVAQFIRLKEMGEEQLKKLLTPEQARQFQPLFSRFEDLSKKDEASILEDQELLQLFSILKDKQDTSDNE